MLAETLPVSNSCPFSTKVWQQPPAWSCCSSTSTLLPALANNNAATSPPAPLPITITSRFSGIFDCLNPAHNKNKVIVNTGRHFCEGFISTNLVNMWILVKSCSFQKIQVQTQNMALILSGMWKNGALRQKQPTPLPPPTPSKGKKRRKKGLVLLFRYTIFTAVVLTLSGNVSWFGFVVL